MFNKLRQNYKLSDVLIRIAFVAAYIFYSWQECLAAANLIPTQVSLSVGATVSVALITALVIGTALMFLVPFVTNLFLNASHLHNVPRAEYALLAHAFCTIYFAVCGALRLINLVTPLLLVWGGVIFPFVVSLGCVIWFYHVTSQLYFNDVTRPFYFRVVAIVYFVCAALFGVVL